MSTILEDRLAILDDLHLKHGGGSIELPCVMNVVDYITGGSGASDSPPCASKLITRFAIRQNDSERFSEYRDELIPYIIRIAGTATTLDNEIKMSFMVSDWAVRVIAPLALDAAGLTEHAAKLRALPEIIDGTTADAASAADAAANAANAAARAAASAARAAAYAAAYAARAAADAANAAARAAASAARAAAYAARAAAYAAANAADAADKRKIWDASLEMLGKLIEQAKSVPAI